MKTVVMESYCYETLNYNAKQLHKLNICWNNSCFGCKVKELQFLCDQTRYHAPEPREWGLTATKIYDSLIRNAE